jgi:hypothetical protein
MKSLILLTAALIAAPSLSHAWSKRGHTIVCQVAGYLNGTSDPKAAFLKAHAYDIGYYCNAPDFFWKKPATKDKEQHNHFMDMEIFERGIDAKDLSKAFDMDRATFNTTYGARVENSAGRSWWRIRELDGQLATVAEKLKAQSLDTPARHGLQAEWLLIAGAIGHYIGDLAQPLHVTENYDGQMTDQKGIHQFFEDEMVDALFLKPGKPALEGEVFKAAQKRWKKDGSALAKKSLLDLLKDLTSDSWKKIDEVLKIEKKLGRKDAEKSSEAYRALITERLAIGAVYLAEVHRRRTGFEFDGKRFFDFHGEPKFIEPPAAPLPARAP